MEKICRLCGEKSRRTLVPIFSFDNERLISDLITVICPIVISLDDADFMPKNICRECLSVIKTAHELREKSLKNDSKFRNSIRSQLQTVIIKEEEQEEATFLKIEELETVEVERESENSRDEDYSENDEINEDDDSDLDFSAPVLEKGKNKDKLKKVSDVPRQPGKRKSNFTKDECSGFFECPDCEETFQYESNLGFHHREYHPGKTILKLKHTSKSKQCEHCGLVMAQSTNYKRHFILYHDPALPYGCPLCTYRFSSEKKLKSHGDRIHAAPDILPLKEEGEEVTQSALVMCDICGKKYVDLKSMGMHMRRVHTDLVSKPSNPKLKPQSCPHCDKVLTTSSNLYRHILYTHPEKHPHQCSLCPEGFRLKRLLLNHLEKAHAIEHLSGTEQRAPVTAERSICQYCSEDCSASKNRLERHLIHAHIDQLDRVLECDICHKKFIYEESLKQHCAWHQRKISEKNFAFRCKQCGKRFQTAKKLEKHTIIHTETSLICHICGKTLKNKFSYEFHVKRHAEVREHQCNQCPASFVYIKQLERHMVGHSEDRKFVCKHVGCTKTFNDSYTFHVHQKRHSGQIKRKYACQYSDCGKSFYTKYALDRHILTHTLQKPHQCEYCEMAYAQRNDLVKHLRIHVGDDIYRCTFDGCLEAFRLQADLKKHYAIHYVKK